jgi:putative transposase
MIATTEQLAPALGLATACDVLSVPRSSVYRARRPKPTPAAQPEPVRALSAAEREQVRQMLNSQRFVDRAPREVYATLLDEGTYLCSPSTMYRVLAEHIEVRERRDQLRHPAYAKPELLAMGPNQVWSWDITKLLGPAKWTYYYLYVMLDIFSRYVVGWLLAEREATALAELLITEACAKQHIRPDQLTLHADRGGPMIAKPVALLMADLGVLESHSRPHVSNDNPFSEAQFKTLKYRPDYPDRFGSQADARAWAHTFFPWYNDHHQHSGIGYMTPAAVHSGAAARLFVERQHVLRLAYAAHPERFVKGQPTPPALPTAVWINPPKSATESAAVVAAVDPVGNSQRSAELSTSPQPLTQKGAPRICQDSPIRL